MSESAAKPDEPSPAKKPSRRRLQFSLRTLLFVVTLLCIAFAWVGWQVRIVQERKAKLAKLLSAGIVVTLDNVREFAKGGPHGVWDDVLIPAEPVVLRDGSTDILWYRRWLGDEAVVIFWTNHKLTAEERGNVEQIFPEAKVRDLFVSPLDY